ncbi:DNA-binding response regulator [Caulobacter flavus]|uniref:DNA-binding response regulator n=1 Tax=Caulobacter flavus TaxID=1679497 RepID=A0A2N5CL40_9CAUL|nr:LytTR family DNA-binding domain-containing protein [Caulobacter flavus]AYV48295.1 DNA-binding response regulator [Caulobacter flavus]PLR06454.1 DNA-binding response regulator [Caulobacter flavus]
MSGVERRLLMRGWLCGLAVVAAITVINILTLIHDAPRLGPWRPAIWEVSSGLVTVFIMLLPAAVALWTHRTRPSLPRALPVHALALLVYSTLHVTGFVVLRKIAHRLILDEGYDFGPIGPEFLYELRKDVIAYVLAFVVFWLLARMARDVAAETPAPATALAPAPAASMFDIRDGARLVRTPVAEILAVRSAGNYAEFLLADGRRPLTRSSLTALEGELGAHGFLRTHRSWLVNAARVTGLRPEGSGDYAVELGAAEAPLSRRYPGALAALRR